MSLLQLCPDDDDDDNEASKWGLLASVDPVMNLYLSITASTLAAIPLNKTLGHLSLIFTPSRTASNKEK
jgi:small nuclear ribonucleoprotein (snRNP)-like protein